MRVMGCDLGRCGALVVLSDDSPGKPRVLEAVAWDEHQSDRELQGLVYRVGRKHRVVAVATEAIIKGWGDKFQAIAFYQQGQQRLISSVCETLQIPLRAYPASTCKVRVGARGRVTLPKGLPEKEREKLRRQANAANKLCVRRRVLALVDGLGTDQTEAVYDAVAIGLTDLAEESKRRMLERAGAAPPRRRSRQKRLWKAGARKATR